MLQERSPVRSYNPSTRHAPFSYKYWNIGHIRVTVVVINMSHCPSCSLKGSLLRDSFDPKPRLHIIAFLIPQHEREGEVYELHAIFFYSLLRIADLVSSTGRTSDAKEQNRMVRLRRARQSKAIIQCIGEAFSVT
jgi:hypothetical protein